MNAASNGYEISTDSQADTLLSSNSLQSKLTMIDCWMTIDEYTDTSLIRH
jgi:hypothetical protein